MANFNKAFKLLKDKKIEFTNCSDTLHVNKGESGLTFYGIYESAHPSWEGWDIVRKAVRTYGTHKASEVLCKNAQLIKKVKDFYKTNFWDPLRGDELPQKVAEEMFVFFLHTGRKKKAIKMAQKAAGMKIWEQDGIIGARTLRRFNSLSKDELCKFSSLYDKYEKAFYTRLTNKVVRLKWALKGFLNRAVKV